MTRLPAPSGTAEHVLARPAPVARPRSPSGSPIPFPTGVVSRPVPGSTLRTVSSSAMYRLPPPNDAPQGVRLTEVAAAGPPTPPASVEMIPAVPGGGAAATVGGAAAAALPPV